MQNNDHKPPDLGLSLLVVLPPREVQSSFLQGLLAQNLAHSQTLLKETHKTSFGKQDTFQCSKNYTIPVFTQLYCRSKRPLTILVFDSVSCLHFLIETIVQNNNLLSSKLLLDTNDLNDHIGKCDQQVNHKMHGLGGESCGQDQRIWRGN